MKVWYLDPFVEETGSDVDSRIVSSPFFGAKNELLSQGKSLSKRTCGITHDIGFCTLFMKSSVLCGLTRCTVRQSSMYNYK
jgi:hypothetical protein